MEKQNRSIPDIPGRSRKQIDGGLIVRLSKQDYITKRLTDREIVVQEIQECIKLLLEIRWKRFMKN